MVENESHLTIVDLIPVLLKEPKIRENIKKCLKEEAINYNEVKIDPKNRRICFGKYSWGGISGFWNNLIKCYDHISYDDFLIKAWDALVSMTVGMPAHEAVLEGLSRETLLRGIHQKEYDWIADRFLDVCRHLTNDGYWKTQGTKTDINSDGSRSHHINGCPYSGLEVEIEPHHNFKQNLHVVDAIGDVFEVINVRWLGGRRR